MTEYDDRYEAAFRQIEAHQYSAALSTLKTLGDEDPSIICWRSICNFALGRFDDALSDSETLLEYNHYSPLACLSIAFVRSTAPRNDLRDAELAYLYMNRFIATYEGDITWREWSIRAAVHAERGDFDKAVEYSKMSLEMAPQPMIERCKSRVFQYLRRIPFRSSDQSIREALLVREIHCVKCCEPTFFRGDVNGEKLPLCCDCYWGAAGNN